MRAAGGTQSAWLARSCSAPLPLSSRGRDHQIILPALPAPGLHPGHSMVSKAAPAQPADAPSRMWRGQSSSHPASQPLAVGGAELRGKMLPLLLQTPHTPIQNENPPAFRDVHSQQQAFHPLTLLHSSCTCSASPNTSSWKKSWACKSPVPRRNHSYLLCADGTLQTVQPLKTGWQV